MIAHIRLALDAAFAAFDIASVAVVGHSMGGYTALAAAGGKPMALSNQTADGVAHPVEVEHDPRIGKVALYAPAIPWLMAPGALANVRAEMFARTGEHDDITRPDFVASILRDTPAEVGVVPAPATSHDPPARSGRRRPDSLATLPASTAPRTSRRYAPSCSRF